MTKFIRLAKDRFLYVTEQRMREDEQERMHLELMRTWPEATLVIVRADEYVDASGDPLTLIDPSELRGDA